MHEIRRAVTVTGTVQGVSFRWYTMQEANRLGLVGWVRNERDGTVRLEAQGPEADVEQLIAWVHGGPPLADVVSVDVEAIEPTTVDIDFSVSDTVWSIGWPAVLRSWRWPGARRASPPGEPA